MSAESSTWLLGYLIALIWKAPLYFQGISWTIIKNCSILSNRLQQSFCPSQNVFLIHFLKRKPRIQRFSCTLWSSSFSSAPLAPMIHYTNHPHSSFMPPLSNCEIPDVQVWIIPKSISKRRTPLKTASQRADQSQSLVHIFLRLFSHSLLLSRSHPPWSSSNKWPPTHPIYSHSGLYFCSGISVLGLS